MTNKPALRVRYLANSQKKIIDSFYEAVGAIDECIDSTLLDSSGAIRSIKLGVETDLFTRWADGKISTSEMNKYFQDIDEEKLADRKVMKDFIIFETCVDDFVSNIYEALAVTRKKLTNTTREQYKNYIKIMKQHFRDLAEIDDNQIKIVYNKIDNMHPKPFVLRKEMPLNQAINFITKNNLVSLRDRYVLNDHVVIFEDMSTQGFVKVSHQFLGPKAYLDPIIAEFHIIEKRETGNKKTWLEKEIKNA